MPVVTRSMGQRRPGLSSTSANKTSRSSDKPPKGSSNATNRSTPKKRSSTSEKRRKAKRAKQPSQNQHKQSCTHSEPDEIEQPSGARKPASPDIPDKLIMHWPCQLCSCPRGAFEYPHIGYPHNACNTCGHEIDYHDRPNVPWNPYCDFVCERTELITSIIQKVRIMKVVVIRATPMTGKSTLLYLLGNRILQEERDLEPVFIHWKHVADRDNVTHEEYLERSKSVFKKSNSVIRPRNSKSKTIYLIDEAQNSYGEEIFWSQTLKNHGTRSKPMFVLVCLYGAAGVSRAHGSDDQSQALQLDALHRVELRPPKLGDLHLLLELEETTTIVQKWAIANEYRFENGVPEYLHAATDGHPGIVGRILQYFEMRFPELPDAIRHARVWSPNLCHELIVEHHGLVDWLTNRGRGLWTISGEEHVQERLRNPIYGAITFSDVKKVLRQVAMSPRGHTRLPHENFDAFSFCHRMGILYTEQAWPGSKELTYTFASPIHRRVAYRRLFPGLDPDEQMKHLTLQQACLNAIQRFSPSALQPRSTQSPSRWGIPEAAFQDELYCCLNYELHNLPILSEFSLTNDGRVDFYIYDKKWCIEVLQCGNKAEIIEHAARFALGGSYRGWNIFEDYVILNFCSRSKLDEIDIEDTDIQPHILQIVIDSEECIAEVFTYDKQSLATFVLGEGRQRPHIEEYELPPENVDALQSFQARLAQAEEREQDTKQQMEQREQDMKKQMEQREQDMKKQMEQREQDMKKQMDLMKQMLEATKP